MIHSRSKTNDSPARWKASRNVSANNHPEQVANIFVQSLAQLVESAVVLTGSAVAAEHALMRSLDEALVSQCPVSKEFHLTWASRILVKQCIRLSRKSAYPADLDRSVDELLPCLAALAPLPRIAFVLRYLFQYPTRDIELLAEVGPRELQKALLDALQTLSKFRLAGRGKDSEPETGSASRLFDQPGSRVNPID